MIKYKNQINTIKYILLLGIFISILFACLVPKVKAETEVARRYNITSADDLTAYSVAYAAGNRNPEDILDIAINSGSTISKDGFVSIGTSDRPFAGTIITPNSGIEIFALYGCPLFDYVSTDMTIGGSGQIKIMRAEPTYTQTGVLTEGSLFANHVIAGTNSASWNVTLVSYTGEDEEDDSFDCVIKDIAASASVDITFTNEADLNIDGSGNVGLICGTLNENANLAVTTVGTNDNLSVTGTGNVGGLVGSMGASATLTFKSNNNSRISTITSSAGNAGGIVGSAVNPNFVFDGVTDYIVKENIEGKTNAGGIAGYYENTSSKTFTLLNTFAIQNDIVIRAESYAGGVFGYLYNKSSFTFNGNKANETVKISITRGTYRGGIIGRYGCNGTKRTLNITNTHTNVSTSSGGSYSAGLISYIEGSSYVNISNCEIETPDLLSGGLIGNINSKGVFVDVSGTITIKGAGKYKAGLVDRFGRIENNGAKNYVGVLRIQGVTDLSQCKFNDWDSAYIVRERSATIIYALGDGEGVKGNWTLKRGIAINKTVSTTRINHDVYSWGNVLRVDGTTLKESNLFTIDSTNHIITVKSEQLNIGDITDFALTYLNINCNYENAGCVSFESSNRISTLLTQNITLSNNINLANTGLNGLLRDDGTLTYSGTFDGGNHKVTLAIGEQFGIDENNAVISVSSTKTGYISKHTYNGLFASLSNATIKNLTVGGVANLYVSAGSMKFSPLVAYTNNTVNIQNVDTDVDVNLIYTDNHRLYIGGIVAYNDSNVAIDTCNAILNIVDTSTVGGGTNPGYYGGIIGFVNGVDSRTQSISITSSSSDLTYNGQDASRATLFGGIIACVEDDTYTKAKRVITVDDFDITLDINGVINNGDLGAVFGYKWASMDAYLSNITVDATIVAINKTTGTAANYGGLLQRASGYIQLDSVSLTKLDYTLATGSEDTFGVLLNKACVYETVSNKNFHQALYVELNNDNYDISALSFTNDPNFLAFDEVVCSSKYHNTGITSNGNSIISISTTNKIIAQAGDTYISKTTYGSQSGKEINGETRYYYDVKNALANIDEDKYAFYIYSIKQYAHSTINAWFNGPTSFTGDLDMTGISYYPVNLSNQTLVFDNCTIKLDNILMQTRVKKSTSSLDTRSLADNTTQHYMMHSAMFLNVTGDITIQNSTLQGNVLRLGSSSCGFIVQKILGNNDTVNTKLKLNNVNLDGVYINTSASNHLTSTSSIAPLLVNKIGKNTSLTIDGLYQSTTAYADFTSYYAGSSLIGNVGDDTARAIYLTFSHIKLDGRKSATSIGNMNDTYGTTRSIFSRAIFLESLKYFGDSSATYNFSLEDDWQNSTSAVHNVAYGKEITSSVEYADMQKTYSGSDYFVSPTAYQQTSETYSFASGYLKYVHEDYNVDESDHEILVNQSYSSAIKGNGKYGDPFIIDSNEKLGIISGIIFMPNGYDNVEISLPSNLTSYNYLSTNYTSEIYAFGSSTFTSTTTTNTKATSAVRKYLSEAYYVVTKDITLPVNYPSLGSNSDYPFKGVIVGSGNPTITNTSPNPLIQNSTGCVVKNLTLVVDTEENVEFSAPTGAALFNYSGGISTYGGLIAQVLGGDTFIDNVHVEFSNLNFNFTTPSNTYTCLIPIGGYIGTIVNGGVIFRNMDSTDVGLTASTYAPVAQEGSLYVNPIIGRVLYGYAFHETDAVHTTEDTTTLKNGLKNYSISDLCLSQTKLSVTKTSTKACNISIPNGQAWYILGAIVNSGAASAPIGNSEGAYDTLVSNSYVLYQGYRNDCAVRGGASYAYVGASGFDAQNDYTSVATLDNYASTLVKIPYIVRAYTEASGGLYFVRSVSALTGSKGDYGNTISVAGNCDIPAGFKGIGNIYINNTKLRLRVYSLTGQSSGTDYAYTVTLNMFFNEYGHYNVSANHAYTNGGKPDSAGFGLFNVLEMALPSETNSINNIILSGNIKYDVYTVNGVKSTYPFTPHTNDKFVEEGDSKIKNATAETVNYNSNLSVGGLIGFVKTKFYIKNVTFNGLNVEGAKDAGGLIGYVCQNNTDISTIKYDSTAIHKGYINAVGGLASGGLIGKVIYTNIEIKGDSTSQTDVLIKEIVQKGQVPNESGNKYGANTTTGAGGLIGCIWCSRGSGNKQEVIHNVTSGINTREIDIENISISKYSTYGTVKILNNSDNHPEYWNYAGGFIGSCHDLILHMTGCSLNNINVSANVAGGIIGFSTQKHFIRMNDVDVISDNNATISATKIAGGIIGFVNNRDLFFISFDRVSVQGYNIESKYQGNSQVYCAAGGIIGLLRTDVKGDNPSVYYICEFNNIYLSNSIIKTNYATSNQNINGTGGFIGLLVGGNYKDDIYNFDAVTSTTYKTRISGYNILFEDNNIIHLDAGGTDDLASNKKIGEIIGNNMNSNPIKLVAVAVNLSERDYLGKIVGYYDSTNNNFGTYVGDNNFTNGTIVFADYSSVQSNETLSNVQANGESINNVEVKAPYISVNPVFNLGNKTITGDGIASSIANLPLTDILSNTTTNETAQFYQYIAGLAYGDSGNGTNGDVATEMYSRIAMFKSEVGNNEDNPYLGPDFPILVLEDPNTINKYINAYLRMITNANYDYSVDVDGLYNVVIYNMVYNNGTFTESLNGASLKRNSSGFYVSFNAFDSGKAQFSLIDVRFKNPAYSSEVVYHLYLPVFIKKVLSFEFEISAQSGTTYLSSKYSDTYGEALIENIGTPITLYFKYTYSRTIGEWQEAINSGENVYRSYSKYLKFEKANTSDQLGALPGDTLLALVDPNNSGKVYYSTFANALMQDGVTLDLSKFKLPVYANGSFTLTGEAFSSIKLCELMDLSIDNSATAAKKFVVCDEEDAYVKVGDTYYRYATDEELSNGSITKYGVKVSGDEEISEAYYLSIFTNASDNYNLFHYYLITSISKFTEGEYPAKMVNNGESESMVHLVMGKIFYHDNFDISSDSKSHNQIMSSTNNELIVSLQAEFGLRDDLDSIIRDYMARLIESTPVYQSFLVYLNRNDGLSNNKIIIGNPDLSGTYSVDYVLDGNAGGSSVNYTNINTTLSYAEFVSGDLKEYFASGNNFEIIAVVKFTYASNAIGSQFPGRNANYPDNGVTVSGSSNLAFIEGATNYSKNSISKDETPAVSYYSEEEPEIAVFDLNPLGNKVGDFTNLGINALNPVEQAAAEFELLGVLDTTSVRSLIGEYDKMIVSFSLSQKINDTYIAVDDITKYINNIKIGSNSLSSQEFTDGKIVSSVDLDDNGAYIVLPNITVNVKTGSALEAQELMYTNYKLTITVVLETEDGVKLIASNANNYIIYTNAKVEPAFIIR